MMSIKKSKIHFSFGVFSRNGVVLHILNALTHEYCYLYIIYLKTKH
jgi:hypothetical protein